MTYETFRYGQTWFWVAVNARGVWVAIGWSKTPGGAVNRAERWIEGQK